MYALAIAMLGAMLVAWNISITEPKHIEYRQQMEGRVAAAHFWGYRSAVARFNYLHPGDTGRTIPYPELEQENLVPLGDVETPPWANGVPPWSNYIENGTLYTFSTSTTPLPAAVIDAIAGTQVRTLTIGIAEANGGTMRMRSFIDGAVVFPLPAAASILPGAIVVIGN